MQTQPNQPDRLSREIESQCASIVEVISPERFNAYRFRKKHASLPPEILFKTLREITTDGPAMEDVEGFAERTLEQLSSFAAKSQVKAAPVENVTPVRPLPEEEPKAPAEGEPVRPQGAAATPPMPAPPDRPEPTAPPTEKVLAPKRDVSGTGSQQEGSLPASLLPAARLQDSPRFPVDGDGVTPKPAALRRAKKATKHPVPSPESTKRPAAHIQAEDIYDNLLGRVYIPRGILKSPVWQNGGLLKIWFWCWMRANHQAAWVSIQTGRGWTQVFVKRGQFVFGRMTAAKALQMDENTVYKRIQKLENMGFCNIQSNTHYSIVTVQNYDVNSKNDLNNYQADYRPSNNQVTQIINDNKLLNNTPYAESPKGLPPGKKREGVEQSNLGGEELSPMLPIKEVPPLRSEPLHASETGNVSNASAALPSEGNDSAASDAPTDGQSASAATDPPPLPAASPASEPETPSAGTPGELSGIARKGKAKKETDPRVKPILAYFYQAHKDQRGIPCKQVWGRDGALIKKLLPNDYPLEYLKNLVDTYFATKNTWWTKDGFTVPKFFQFIEGIAEEYEANAPPKILLPREEFERGWTEMMAVCLPNSNFNALKPGEVKEEYYDTLKPLTPKRFWECVAWAKTQKKLPYVGNLMYDPGSGKPIENLTGSSSPADLLKSAAPKAEAKPAQIPEHKTHPAENPPAEKPVLEEAEIRKTAEWFRLHAATALAGIVKVSQPQVDSVVDSIDFSGVPPENPRHVLMWLTLDLLMEVFGEDPETGDVKCSGDLSDRVDERVYEAYRENLLKAEEISLF